MELPSMWREELLHPLSVHFPIGILSLAGVVGLVMLCLFFRKKYRNLRFSFSLLLWSGILLFWIAFYTGQIAYSIEVRKLCDPTVVKDHLYWAYVSGIVFSTAVLLDMSSRAWKQNQSFLLLLSLLCSIAGSGFLAYTGHLGAKLVYQQAAAVYQPTEKCNEFQ